MTISIIGTGYVGLVTGAVLADFGHTVFCIDIDHNKIESLKQSQIPFYEPGLEDLVHKNFQAKRLQFTTNYQEAVPKSEVVFICVGTPPKPNGEANLEYVIAAVTEAGKHLKEGSLIVIKSTAPIGVEIQLKELVDAQTDKQYEFASCPEFLKEGTAVQDTLNPDRIIIGTQSQQAAKKLLKLYNNFPGERLTCDIHSAQMIKYAANSFLATKISFANAISQLAEKLDANATEVLKGIGLDPRIGPRFLNPGIGYGGSCFPKDVSAFIETAGQVGYDFQLLKATQQINHDQIDFYLDHVQHMIGSVQGQTLAALGLAFKPDTDDVRESASIKVIQKLVEAGATVQVYDPIATENARKVLGDTVTYCTTPYQAAEQADALLILTEWNEFKNLDLQKIKISLKQPIIIDGRNIYEADAVKELGFQYQGIGKK